MFFSLTFFFLPIHELLCFELVLRAILFGGTTRNDKKKFTIVLKIKSTTNNLQEQTMEQKISKYIICYTV